MDSVVGVFGGVAVVVAIAWAFWSLAYNFRRGWVAKKQAEVQLRLLERLGTGAEVLAYLRSEEHTSELQSPCNLVCRLLLEKKKGRASVSRTLLVTRPRPYYWRKVSASLPAADTPSRAASRNRSSTISRPRALVVPSGLAGV